MYSTEAPQGVPRSVPPGMWPDDRRKSRSVAGLFAFFLGIFGAHDFYLGRRRQGWIHLGLVLAGIVVAWGATLAGASVPPTGHTFGVLLWLAFLSWLVNVLWVLIDFLRILRMPGLGR